MIAITLVAKDGTALNGFKWPVEEGAIVSDPQWNPKDVVNGLFGLRAGENNLGGWIKNATYLALDLAPGIFVAKPGCTKIRKAEILYSSDSPECFSKWLEAYGHTGPWFGGVCYRGSHCIAAVGDFGKAVVKEYGVAIGGRHAMAVAGCGSKAIAGEYGSAYVESNSIAMVGQHGTVRGGEGSILQIEYHDYGIPRIMTRYVGEEIEADVEYCFLNGKFTRKERKE